MRGEGLILAALGLAGLGFAGMFLKKAVAAPEVPPVPPEPVPPPTPPGEAILVATAEATASIAVEAIAEEAELLKGDMNGDGVLDATDLAMLERYVTEGPGGVWHTSLTGSEMWWAADVNGDGNVDELDIAALEILITGITVGA